MQDIITSIKAYLYDRAASPLTGAFVVAWAVWNYRFLVILLSSDFQTTAEKFKAIDENFVAHTFSIVDWTFSINGVLLDGALIPVGLAFVYIFVYPIVAKPVYEHSLKRQKELRSIRQEQENQRLLTVEESRELFRRLAQMQAKHQNDIDSYNNQISSLNQRIEELEGDNSSTEPGVSESVDTHFDDAGDADPDEWDTFIQEAVANRKDGQFQLYQLFGQERWQSLPVPTRQALGKRFRAQVQRGDYVGVSVSGKDSGNQQTYFKRVSD